jgi:hypothetical protein
MNMKALKGEEMTGTDAEAYAYLYTASLTQPMGHDYGIMMGYVVLAPLISAVASVETAMKKRQGGTRQCSGLAPNNSLSSHPHTRHSSHIQNGATIPMTLVHLFLDLA